ncbi:MAG: response regulator [candidate division KSB1 bacterium]|nr:response regulator [candidate division KSB1 bacterium]
MAQKILIVDDDADFIDINTRVLGASGYETESASTSEEALQKLRGQKFDLAIVDLMIEDLDSGFNIAYAIRDDEKLRDMPILMLTSAPRKTGVNINFPEGKDWMKVDDFAEKPLKPAELVNRVKQLLKSK